MAARIKPSDFCVDVSGTCGFVQMPRSERTSKMLQDGSWINGLENFLRRKMRGRALVIRSITVQGTMQTLFKLVPIARKMRGKKHKGRLSGLQHDAMRAIRLFCRSLFRHTRQKGSAHERNEQRLTIRRHGADSRWRKAYAG